MGIFADRLKQTGTITPTTKTTTPKKNDLQGTVTQYQNIAKQKNITLPKTPQEKPKRSLLQKAGSFLSSFETGPAVQAALKGENPFKAYKQSIGRGLSAKEDITSKTVYSDVLETAGWKTAAGTGSLKESATWKNFGREMVGLAADILGDPTTYLTVGTSASGKMGAKALTQLGKKEIKNVAKAEAKLAGTEITDEILKKATAKVEATGNKAFFDQGGIKFAGKTLVSGEKVAAPFNKAGEAIRSTKVGEKVLDGMGAVKDTFGKLFARDYGLDEKALKVAPAKGAQYVDLKQRNLDLFNADSDDIMKEVSTVFKHTTKKDRELISEAIEKDELYKLNDFLRPIAENTKSIFKRIADVEGARGLLDHTLEDYVTHIYKNKKQSAKLMDFIRTGVRGGDTRFAKERLIPTIEEAKKLGLEPETDAANIIATRLMASQKAIREQDLLREVAENYGQSTDEILSSANKFKAIEQDLVEYTNGEFKGMMIPRAIAKDLEKVGKQFMNDEATMALVRNYDAVRNFFKGSVTSIFPGFHGRNFLSNVAQNFLDLGVQVLNPIMHIKTMGILGGAKKGSFVTDMGRKYSYDEVRKMLKQYNIIRSPGARDVVESVQSKIKTKLSWGSVGQGVTSELKRLPTQQNIAFRAGRKLGDVIESDARTFNFLTNLRRGFSPEEAAKRTKEFLFDYDNLSPFEKNIMRRIIPFYTWTRKNIELQGKYLVKQPGKISSMMKAQRLGDQESAKERQALPEYMAESLALKANKGIASNLLSKQAQKSGLVYYLTGMGLPLENAFSNLPQGINRDDMIQYLNKLASQTDFGAKYVTELATGHVFFQNKPIKDVYTANEYANTPQFIKDFLELKEKKVEYTDAKGNKIKYSQWVGNPYKIHLLRSLPTSRGFTTAASASDDNLTTLGKIIKNVTGIKIYPLDVETMSNKELKTWISDAADILENYGELRKFESYYEDKTK